MKKLLFLLGISILIMLGGCSEGEKSYIIQKEYQGDLAVVHGATDMILDEDGKLIAEFESDGGIFLSEDYIFFSRVAVESSDSNRMKDFFCLDLTTQRYSYLGTIECYGTSTIMGVTEKDHHLYQFVLHGDPFDGDWNDDHEELRLYDFDLKNKTVTHIRTSKFKHPYNDIQAYENKLLIKDGNQIVEFDVVSQEEQILLEYTEFDSKKMIGEMVYACFMDTDKHELSVVIIQVNGEENTSLRIDTYDANMQQIRSFDISKAASHTGETNFSMLGQVVTDFFVKGNYFYYSQNAHHILGEIAESGVTTLIDRENQKYAIVSNISSFSDIRYFCNYIFGESIEETRLFQLDLIDGEYSQATIEFCSEQEQILSAMHASNGNLLLQTVTPETTYGDVRVHYLLDESNIQFIPCGKVN